MTIHYTRSYTASERRYTKAKAENLQSEFDLISAGFVSVDTDIGTKADENHDHTGGGGAVVASIVAAEANLGSGTTTGEIKICSASGNQYIWDGTNSKWRVISGNHYTLASLPSFTTYTITEGTVVFTTDEDGNNYTADATNSKWRVQSGNKHALASLPSFTTYTIEEGTIVSTTDEDGNIYTADETNSKWRVHSGNRYATGNLPSATTYTIENGTEVFDITTKRWQIRDGSTWRDRDLACVFSVENTSQINLSNGVTYTVQFDQNEYDPNGCFDAVSTYAFTAPYTADYQFNLTLGPVSLTGSTQVLAGFYDGSDNSYVISRVIINQLDADTDAIPINIPAVISLAANDKVKVRVTINGAGTADISSSYFSGFVINPKILS